MTEAQSIVEDFVFAYKEWLDNGAPEGQPFMRGDDLEQNMYHVAKDALGDVPVLMEAREAIRALYQQFGLDKFFPFNNDVLTWLDEVVNDKYHTNKEMLKWVSQITSD